LACRALVALVLLAFPASAAAAEPSYYLSLGDSWAQGVMRVHGVDRPTNRGFSDVLYRKLRRTEPDLRLVKLGCRAAGAFSMIHGQRRCGVLVPYRGSQLSYARAFLRAHRGQVALVTVIIGGNDVWACRCVRRIAKNLPTIARELRRAAGPRTQILGLTYANILLARDEGTARSSVELFRTKVNPTMKAAYARYGIGFVDATAAFGGYRELPEARAQICRYAYACDHPDDLHLNARGYDRLARITESAATRALRARAAAPCSPRASRTTRRTRAC
jgi:lysophospholipase L1-like esterase